MRRMIQGLALSSLLLSACGGYGYLAVGIGVGYGWDYGGDYYYDDCSCYSMVASDFDGDGALDMAVADGRAGVVWLVPGRPGGTFADAPSDHLDLSAVPGEIAPANADGDGATDLMVLDGVPGDLETFAGDGDGGFSRAAPPAARVPTSPGLNRFASGDLDGDALDDLVTVDERGTMHVALRADDGSLRDVGLGDPAAEFLGPDAALRLAGVHLVLAKLDGRPGTDLVVVDGERSALAIFSGHGDGTFGEPLAAPFRPMGDVLSVAPVTRGSGGSTDLAVLFGNRNDPAAESTLAVLRWGDGSIALDGMRVGSARSVAACDLEGDGRTDLLLADPLHGAVRALRARR